MSMDVIKEPFLRANEEQQVN